MLECHVQDLTAFRTVLTQIISVETQIIFIAIILYNLFFIIFPK